MPLTQTTTPNATFAPLRVTRDPAAFESWWPTLTDTTDIADGIHALRNPHISDVESSLRWLMITTFQGPEPVPWLQVRGLSPTAQLSYLVLDTDIAHDNDGNTVGVDVILSMHVRAADGTVVATTPTAYVQWPAKVFAPTSTKPRDALAAIIDTALDLVNATIADQDHFADLARAPHAPAHAASAEDTDDDQEIERCRDCGRITRIDDEPIDTDAADGWNGYCGTCADRREH
ncbi:hypothetical protein [Mycobacterium avium]|uniref:hypothetical protein n=1 Tax=Mycobacterium avium TaxID=1764 RepID=UPI000B4B17F5|nr:hypothetical protein [Mycobacterium avium]